MINSEEYLDKFISEEDFFTLDEYKEVTISEKTGKSIASLLLLQRPVLLGITDNLGSHHDVLFTFVEQQNKSNNLHSGLQFCSLFISIMHVGSFGFLIEYNSLNQSSVDYYAEKLGMSEKSPTTYNFAVLFNLVRKHITILKQYRTEANYLDELIINEDTRNIKDIKIQNYTEEVPNELE